MGMILRKEPLTPTLSPQAGRGSEPLYPLAPLAGRGRGPRSGKVRGEPASGADR